MEALGEEVPGRGGAPGFLTLPKGALVLAATVVARPLLSSVTLDLNRFPS